MTPRAATAIMAGLMLGAPAFSQDTASLAHEAFDQIRSSHRQQEYRAGDAQIRKGYFADEFGWNTPRRNVLFDDGREMQQYTHLDMKSHSLHTRLVDGPLKLVFRDARADGVGTGDSLDITYTGEASYGHISLHFKYDGNHHLSAAAKRHDAEFWQQGSMSVDDLSEDIQAMLQPFKDALEAQIETDYTRILRWSEGDPFPVDLSPYQQFVDNHSALLDTIARDETPGLFRLWELYRELKNKISEEK